MELKNAQAAQRRDESQHGASPGGARLPEIEMLRAVAVLMVLLGHIFYGLVFWPSHFVVTYIMPSGLRGGVDLFFAISGFVIARSLLPRLENITAFPMFLQAALDFWIARAWRLLPSAWLWLTVPLILCLAFNRTGVYGTFASNWSMFIAGLLFLGNFHYVIAGPVPFTAFPQWSLSLEEQFYMMLPFAAFFFRRQLVWGLALIVLAGFFVPNTTFTLAIRLWPVALGVLLALWSRHPTYQAYAPAGLARHPFARAALLILLLACLVSVGSPDLHIVSFYQGVVAILSGLLVWLGSYDRQFLSGPGPFRRVMEIIAARSYSLYLIHIPVYCSMCEIWRRWHGSTMPSRAQEVAIFAAAGLMLAVVTELNHRLLEKPLREHGKRVVARRRAVRAAAQSNMC
jgi:peptidoglycan/LPS O-acetylase OafA/YrhL